MTIVTRRRVTEFTVLPNEIANDAVLSFEARGLLCYLLSKPDNWQIQITDIQKNGGIGRDKAYKILGELKTRGYIVVDSKRAQNQRFTKHNYIVYDCIQSVSYPLPENPEVAQNTHKKPLTENPEVAAISEPLPENPYTENQDGIIRKDFNIIPPTPQAAQTAEQPPVRAERKKRENRSTKNQAKQQQEELFNSLWEAWPNGLRPQNRLITFRQFQALSPQEQEEAYNFADTYLRRCKLLKATPLLIIYLKERKFSEFVSALQVDKDGYFIIPKGSKEWNAWKEFFEKKNGAQSVRSLNERDHILRKTQLPDFKQSGSEKAGF